MQGTAAAEQHRLPSASGTQRQAAAPSREELRKRVVRKQRHAAGACKRGAEMVRARACRRRWTT